MAIRARPVDAQVSVDGRLNDGLWKRVPRAKLVPTDSAVPAALGGEIRVAIAGGYLYLGAELPEPAGRVTAHSIGFDPIWEGGGEARSEPSPRRYTFGAPEGEDF